MCLYFTQRAVFKATCSIWLLLPVECCFSHGAPTFNFTCTRVHLASFIMLSKSINMSFKNFVYLSFKRDWFTGYFYKPLPICIIFKIIFQHKASLTCTVHHLSDLSAVIKSFGLRPLRKRRIVFYHAQRHDYRCCRNLGICLEELSITTIHFSQAGRNVVFSYWHY
jgi:hypothetical protein